MYDCIRRAHDNQRNVPSILKYFGMKRIGCTEHLRLVQWFCYGFDLEQLNISCGTGLYSAGMPFNYLKWTEILWNPTWD